MPRFNRVLFNTLLWALGAVPTASIVPKQTKSAMSVGRSLVGLLAKMLAP